MFIMYDQIINRFLEKKKKNIIFLKIDENRQRIIQWFSAGISRINRKVARRI